VCQVVHAIINQTHNNANVSPELEHNIEQLTETLRKIHGYIMEQSKKSKMSRFLRNADDAEEVKQYGDELRHALDLFGVSSAVFLPLPTAHDSDSCKPRFAYRTSCTGRFRWLLSSTTRSSRT